MTPLYDHQHDALNQLARRMGTGLMRLMLQAPTGFGKTLLAAEIIRRALAKGNRVVFTVPSISLIDQTVEKFRAEGITDIGVIQADHPGTDPHARVQIASVQTLARRAYPDTDLVIVDEAHEAFRAVFNWMTARPKLHFIGLSATPWTKGLGKHYQALIVAATTADLIRKGFLSKFRVFAPSHPDLSRVSTVAGDYHEGELGDAMDEPQLTADIVSTWLSRGENRPTLCFAVNRAHARKLMDEFEAANVTVAYVDKDTPRDVRTRLGEDFNSGHIKVVVNVGVLVRGIDWDVRCLILARPTKSEIRYTQIIGRALRVAEGKDDALILDHSDTTLNLGLVTDIHHDRLDGGLMADAAKPRKREVKVKVPTECPSCQFLKPAGIHVCPECGFVPAPREDVATKPGELFQINGKPKAPTKADKQAFWSGLRWYMANEGRTEKWALAQYKSWSGAWPKGLTDTPRPPNVICRNFVVSQFIRWQKRQRRKDRQVRDAA